jgi:hypothetical protein
MKTQERRTARRVPIKVLVKCLPPGLPATRNGHETLGWNMWASNLGDDGVGLHWSKSWATMNCLHCLKQSTAKLPRTSDKCVCNPPHQTFKTGQRVHVEGLVYSEKGAHSMIGRIQWVRPSTNGRSCDIGIAITSRDHRSFFKALMD